MAGRRPLVNRETTCLPDQLDGFYGRDGDMEAIRSLLLSDDANPSNPGVIPIVGMGGIGKTTLAQHLYNDEEVAKHFNIRGWICVSVEFTVLRLTKLILDEVTGRAPDFNNLNQLQCNLKDALHGRKFLLVLDDVWSDNYNEWTKLLTPLRFGEAGSKIIITTRQESVASMGQTVSTRFLKVLKDEDCWKLFAGHASLDKNPTANPPELQEIANEIVRKCRGLPLAAKALGGVLRRQTRAEKWKEVLKSEIWHVQNANILPALAMSYIHLPSQLKRCFAYCAVFPQDHQFRKEELVALWKSEGFLVQQKGDYFDDLVSRSFFEQRYDWFVMHDLVHDLARFVSGHFCSKLEGGTSWKIGERTRHLSYARFGRDVLENFPGIHDTSFLRSFVHTVGPGVLCQCFWSDGGVTACIDKEVIDDLLPTWKLLKVLSLQCIGTTELSISIGNLKHLRYLNLSGTSIRLLPEAVTALFNLEILILRGCSKLEELPADMARLINLRQLDLRETPGLKWMPPEMGKLKKLSQLSDFVVGENEGSNMKELGRLRCLRGQISIRGLQNVKDAGDASEALLKDKENLTALILSWDGRADDSWQVKQVLERLQPHTQIENIEIKGYGGTTFPNWVGDVSFSKLKKLRLIRCMNCICLPPLGRLESLEVLSICYGDCPRTYNELVEVIGAEFYGKCKPGKSPFSSLKRLEFEHMGNWREWSCFSGAFPVLEELELSDCPKLKSVSIHFRSLKRLRICRCGELDFEYLLISAHDTLESIGIWDSEKVKCIPVETFPNLKNLRVQNCSNLESLGSTAAAAATTTTTTTRTSDPFFSPSLISLCILNCAKFSSFSRGLHAPKLESIYIGSCSNLKSLPCLEPSLLPSLVNFCICGCPEIESFPEGGLPSQLQYLQIVSCEKLVGGRMQWGLQSLSCLSSISIGGGGSCEEDVESSFPEETLLPSSLRSLEIRGFAKMKSLNYKGLQHLSSLRELHIIDCENLESLPEEELLSCLSSLRIWDCPLLEKRCEREIGEDWPKIKHIPRLCI